MIEEERETEGLRREREREAEEDETKPLGELTTARRRGGKGE